MRSFKSNENIRKKEGGSDYVNLTNKYRQNVSLGVSDQARHKPACAATEGS